MDRNEVHRQAAGLHAECINQGFLASLGVPFLTLLYRAIDEAEHSVLLFNECDGKMLGFVAGGIGMGPIYRRMLRRPLRLAVALCPVLVRPSAMLRIFDIVRYGQGSMMTTKLPEAELLSIAVASNARGAGVAESLYGLLVDYFRESGIDEFRIVVGDGLLPAHRFYQKMGAIPVETIEVHAGECSTVYVHSIPPSDAASSTAIHPQP